MNYDDAYSTYTESEYIHTSNTIGEIEMVFIQLIEIHILLNKCLNDK